MKSKYLDKMVNIFMLAIDKMIKKMGGWARKSLKNKKKYKTLIYF